MEIHSSEPVSERLPCVDEARVRRARRRFWALLIGVPVLLVAAAYGVLAWQYYSQSVRITKNYAAELNAPILAVPEEKRAWTHYRRALEMLERKPEFDYDEPGDRPGQPNWQATVAYLRRNRQALEAIRRASQMLPLGHLLQKGVAPEDVKWLTRHQHYATIDGIEYGDPTENVDLSKSAFIEPVQLIDFARLLLADCKLAGIERDGERISANLSATLDMAAQCEGCRYLITCLIGSTLRGMAVHQLFETLALDNSFMSDEQLAHLARRLESSDVAGALAAGLTGERTFFLDALQRNFTDDGQGNGWVTPAGLDQCRESIEIAGMSLPHPIMWMPCPLAARATADRRDTQRKYDERYEKLLDMVKVPLWKRPVASEIFDDEGNPFGPPYWFVNEAVTYLGPTLTEAEQALQRRDAALVAIALVRFQRRNSAWPASLAQLSPEFIKNIPPDRFVGDPLKYRVVDGKPILYSVGTDLDDDGGKRVTDGPHWAEIWPPDTSIDGDWVLWPLPAQEEDSSVTFVTPGDMNAPVTEGEIRKPPEPEGGDVEAEPADSSDDSPEPCR
jgi:hypothetical protein